MKAGETVGVLAFLAVIIFMIGAASGFVINIYKFATLDFEAPYKAEVVRGIGIPFAPMGAIVGWLNIEDGVEARANALIKDAKKRLEIK